MPVTDVGTTEIAFDIRDTWQAKLLAGVGGWQAAIVLSVLAHNFDDAMPILLETVYPGFRSIRAPFLCTAAKIDKSGAVVADVVGADGSITKDMVFFFDEMALRNFFRRLADRIKLEDGERIEMFKCVRRWVVADRRLDPAMDPKDPDAKRCLH